MIVFQTPTHPVIISNLGWCTSVKKKRKQLGQLLTQQNLRFLPKEKKQASFFKKICVKYTLSKKQKELFWKLLVEKASVDSFGLQNEKEKEGLYLQSFDLNDKTLLILFKAKFAYGQKQNREHLPLEKKTALFCFVFFRVVCSSKFPKWRKQKTNKQSQKFFFLFVKATILLCKTMEHFFVSQLSKINKPLAIAFGWKKKKQPFFLAWEVEKLRFYKKTVNIRDL